MANQLPTPTQHPALSLIFVIVKARSQEWPLLSVAKICLSLITREGLHLPIVISTIVTFLVAMLTERISHSLLSHKNSKVTIFPPPYPHQSVIATISFAVQFLKLLTKKGHVLT